MSLEGKVCVVTGGASGMGAASIRAFANAGATTVLVDIDKNGADLVAKETGALMMIGDVADSSFCTKVADDVVRNQGQIDILVNCAGTILRADAINTSDDEWRRILAVNVDGVFFMSRAVVRHMIHRASGSIVNFGSIWGDVGASGVTAYCATKGAVHQITKAMALDHVENGIRVNAVAPGEVNTPMLSSGRLAPPSAADLANLAQNTIPMKRLAEPEEIAEVVLFLASDKSSYMTGVIVPVDAGYTAR
ncbi:MAG: short-chain dehydrogenase [Acidiferrobacteraceae bacterium]|nr:short-chain dehydrogenase [Acidiferrobacteraceae bacterium]